MLHMSFKVNLLSVSRNLKLSNFIRCDHHCCKVLVVGGGTGGCTMAAKLSKKFQKAPNHVIIIEPQLIHYYQPLFTLIGGGITNFDASKKCMKDVLPKNAQWLQDKVVDFFPEENQVKTLNGDIVKYEVMIVSTGLELHWDLIPGLLEGLQDQNAQVCSIYGSDTVSNVFDKVKKTKSGNAIFTFPNTPVKCAGAPQKIAYLSEDYWSKHSYRKDIDVLYTTSLPVIFGVKKYAEALCDVCQKRNINVKMSTELVAIEPNKKKAVFKNLKDASTFITQYSLLHVCPPMGPVAAFRSNKKLTNSDGYLEINPKSLQHVRYKNIYGIGDCTNAPTSKTMAAAASQGNVLYKNIVAHLNGIQNVSSYDGYTSCPLVTARGKCIMAEFDYNLSPKETFPIDQSKEHYTMYFLKRHVFPLLYWDLMLKGYWNGPEVLRKIFSYIKKKENKIIKK